MRYALDNALARSLYSSPYHLLILVSFAQVRIVRHALKADETTRLVHSAPSDREAGASLSFSNINYTVFIKEGIFKEVRICSAAKRVANALCKIPPVLSSRALGAAKGTAAAAQYQRLR